MKTLHVDLASRSYPIYIGTDLLEQRALFEPHLKSSTTVFIVSNTTVAPLYAKTLTNTLSQLGKTVRLLELPDGESFKDWQHLQLIFDELLAHGADRQSMIVALGGGVVGDMTGFAAASYMRGVPFVQVPTTLLAQVDSSVGGKTAINHPLGKNMIGAFYQPLAVFADISVLTTLPDREYAAGLAEVVKYGIIYDADFFTWMEDNAQALMQRDKSALTHIITRSCEVKAAVVSEDEREGGRRAILNYGHTFGHAIEKLLGYGKLLHGEAVSIGMVMAARLSVEFSGLPLEDCQRIEKLLQQLNLPVSLEGLALKSGDMIEAMGMDKKVVDGELRFIVADQMGAVRVAADVSIVALEKTLAEFC